MKWPCPVAGCDASTKSKGPNNEPSFASKQGLDKHMRLHVRGSKAVEDLESVEGWKPQVCPNCDKKLESGRKFSLKRHLESPTACKGKKDAKKNDAAAPDDLPSNLHKHDDGDDNDDQGFGGMGGMGGLFTGMQGQAGLSNW
ncbi:hypothetical protein PENSPDRAFT_655455 [Peniophora sp. CONT]|nr:hypothetical protein PENSPDRAFT_655455 [Peniophora sp. CONT]